MLTNMMYLLPVFLLVWSDNITVFNIIHLTLLIVVLILLYSYCDTLLDKISDLRLELIMSNRKIGDLKTQIEKINVTEKEQTVLTGKSVQEPSIIDSFQDKEETSVSLTNKKEESISKNKN